MTIAADFSIVALMAAGTAVGDIEIRVCNFAIAIYFTFAFNALVVLADLAVCAFIIAVCASIEIADEISFLPAIGHAVSCHAFPIEAGFAVWAAVSAFAAGIKRIGCIICEPATECVTEAPAIDATLPVFTRIITRILPIAILRAILFLARITDPIAA